MGFKILNGPLDPDKREAYIVRKIDACTRGYPNVPFRDPAQGMVRELQLGEFMKTEVEPWLTPTPPPEMLFMLTVENFVTFMDSNGCRDYSNAMKDHVRTACFLRCR